MNHPDLSTLMNEEKLKYIFNNLRLLMDCIEKYISNDDCDIKSKAWIMADTLVKHANNFYREMDTVIHTETMIN